MTETNVRDLYIIGLRNVHAMENQALSIMKPQESRVETYPEVAALLSRHIGETEQQIERLETVLGALGEDSSTFKDWALSAVGGMAALGHTMADDEILKNAFANFAFENYEIAAYTSLICLAEAVGDDAGKRAIEMNLAEERDMAQSIETSLTSLTMQFASLQQAGEYAKT